MTPIECGYRLKLLIFFLYFKIKGALLQLHGSEHIVTAPTKYLNKIEIAQNARKSNDKISKKFTFIFAFQAVFERLVDIICDKMSESLDSDPSMLNSNKGTRLGEAQASNFNCNC